jgi:hypothetical protein
MNLHLYRKTRTLFQIRLPYFLNSLKNHIYSMYLAAKYKPYYRNRLKQINQSTATDNNPLYITLGKVEFYDLLPVYTNLLEKFLGSSSKHLFVSDKFDERCPSAIVINKPFRWLLLDILSHHVDSPYIILLHLDYFLLAPIDQNRIKSACKIMDSHKHIDFIQLARNCGELHRESFDEEYNYSDDSSELFFNMQVRIWRRSSLFKLFIRTRFNNISNERLFSQSARHLGFQGLISKLPVPSSETCLNNAIYPYIATALNARKWRKSFAPVLQPLLNNHEINPDDRGWTI